MMTDCSDETPPDGYRRGVGLMMFNDDGRIFTGKRIDTDTEAWQMPQGGIDPGETPRDAALRELLEEAGTDKVEIVAESVKWRRYDFPAALRNKIWNGRYLGQTQKWFAIKFMGNNADINIHGEEPEFNSWRWSPIDDLPRNIVDFKRALYTDIAAEFRELIQQNLNSHASEND
jgi:putative (di)nucleoside polyphosphate hydrolase